jgi:hypothetical protein
MLLIFGQKVDSPVQKALDNSHGYGSNKRGRPALKGLESSAKNKEI